MITTFVNSFSLVLPLSVRIIKQDFSLIAGNSVNFECAVKGAHPKPRILWLKENFELGESLQYVRSLMLRTYFNERFLKDSGDETIVSTIFLTLDRKDHEKELTCRAVVQGLEGFMEDRLKLSVQCKI